MRGHIDINRLRKVINESGFFLKPLTADDMLNNYTPTSGMHDHEETGIFKYQFRNAKEAKNFAKYLLKVKNIQAKVTTKMVRIQITIPDSDNDKP